VFVKNAKRTFIWKIINAKKLESLAAHKLKRMIHKLVKCVIKT